MTWQIPLSNITHVIDTILDGISQIGEELVSCNPLHLSDGVHVKVFLPVSVSVPANESNAHGLMVVYAYNYFEKRLRNRNLVRADSLMNLTLKEDWTTDYVNAAVLLCPFPACDFYFFPVPSI